jgi:hypothetical protein
MKILLDECVPRRLRNFLPGHEIKTVPEMGWGGIKNGKLLAIAQEEFEVFLTVDQNLPFQQNLARLRICVMVVPSRSNDINDLLPLVPAILAALPTVEPGQVITVRSATGSD